MLIAHDHPIFRDGLRELLETDPEIDIVGEAANGREAVDLARGLDPDILLLDMSMPGTDGPGGMDVLRELSAECGSVRTLLLTAGIEKPEILRALRLGVRGVVPKDAPTELLFRSIRAVMAGE